MKDYHHLDASNLRFSIFSSNNLRALSVAKVVTPLVFDQLGHPLPGGLYDQKMGKCTLQYGGGKQKRVPVCVAILFGVFAFY